MRLRHQQQDISECSIGRDNDDNETKHVAFLIPSFAIISPAVWPPQRVGEDNGAKADSFDRRIISWLTFGPVLTIIAMSLVSGRGAQPMWGYPVWLFLGLWLVMQGRAITRPIITQVIIVWAVVFSAFVAVVAIDNSGWRVTGESYRASLFPGKVLADELSRQFEQATGRPLTYVIGPAWEGGNVSHYAPTRPRLLIDGDPARAPWIDLADLKAKGAVLVWSDQTDVLPEEYKAVAPSVEHQSQLVMKLYRNGLPYTVGWAILRPR